MNSLYNILFNQINITNLKWHDLANIDPITGFCGVITNDTMISWSFTLNINGAKIQEDFREFATDLYDDNEFLMVDVINDQIEDQCKAHVLQSLGLEVYQEI